MRRREIMKAFLAGSVGAAASPVMTRAQAAPDCKATTDANIPKRIDVDQSCGIIIDVQRFFLLTLEAAKRQSIVYQMAHFVRLLSQYNIPIVATLETPIHDKGLLPKEIKERLDSSAETFVKRYYDLSKEQQIRDHLAQLKRKQVIIAGCETDVCVLQSCLGLLSLGYEVFVVENLVFSSSPSVDAAILRMRAEGATILSYKSLFYELIERVEPREIVQQSATKTVQ
jgi:nicotinamidase-related amidase